MFVLLFPFSLCLSRNGNGQTIGGALVKKEKKKTIGGGHESNGLHLFGIPQKSSSRLQPSTSRKIFYSGIVWIRTYFFLNLKLPFPL